MGYEIDFIPPESVMETFQNKFPGLATVNSESTELLIYCLQAQNEKDHLSDTIFQINTYLSYLASLEKKQLRQYLYDCWKSEPDHRIWFCGWDMERDCEIDENSLLTNTCERLTVLKCVVPTPDYYDDSEKFSQKWNEVSEEIQGFLECIDDIERHKIKDELIQYEVKDDEKDEEILS